MNGRPSVTVGERRCAWAWVCLEQYVLDFASFARLLPIPEGHTPAWGVIYSTLYQIQAAAVVRIGPCHDCLVDDDYHPSSFGKRWNPVLDRKAEAVVTLLASTIKILEMKLPGSTKDSIYHRLAEEEYEQVASY